MRKQFLLLVLLLIGCCHAFAQQAKYIFYFIGDGMGVNQVQVAELYRGELNGRIGVEPLLFGQFPYATMATTFSATNGVTDSAAGGTALATGHKTKNSALGMLKDLKTPITSVAVWAQKAGLRVGIATSVSVDHATPASFYAHVPKRKQYFDIGKDLYNTNFDFYAGSDFLKPVLEVKGATENLYDMADRYGYTIARGYADYLKKTDKSQKMILLQTEEASKVENASIPFAIDRKKGDMTLQEITRAGLNFLSKDLSKGFFFMVEGGKIDWACHSNDGATVIHEVIDLDNAIKVAYEFYQQHPDETLIVVTADHETGGLALGTGPYQLNLQVLQHQKMSEATFTRHLHSLRNKYNNKVSWEVIQASLRENFGFWDKVTLTSEQEKRLKDVYEDSFDDDDAVKMKESEYYKNEPLATEAKKIINEMAFLSWASGGHSAGYVPVFAIGAGAELFKGRMDNIDIPKKIAEAGGFVKQ